MSGFKSLLILQFLSDSHETFTHVLCANTHKTVEHIFKILILKFLSNFLNFAFGQSLAQQQRSSLGEQASLV